MTTGMPPALLCQACQTPLEARSMNADGTRYSCSCGRTCMTVLNEGKLDLGTDDEPSDGRDLRGGRLP